MYRLEIVEYVALIALLFWIPMRIILGFRKPRKPILGVELSGEIEDIGTDVTQFKKGDQVFALTELNLGGYAEYTCVHESGLIALKPTNVTYEEAAVIPFGGTSALHFLRKGQIKRATSTYIRRLWVSRDSCRTTCEILRGDCHSHL